jgi:starch synthase (maltosyl-transferring)
MRLGDIGLDGRTRVVIEGLSPDIDAGQFPIKRVIGEQVDVEAFVFADGHDVLSVRLKFRHEAEESWSEVPMELQIEDRWTGSFPVERTGTYFYTVQGWVNHFETWRRDLDKKFEGGQDVEVDLLAGAALIEGVASDGNTLKRELQQESTELRAFAEALRNPKEPVDARVAHAQTAHLAELMEIHGERSFAVQYGRELKVNVEQPLARFSAWYEVFPRSASAQPGVHGTFKDVERWLPRIAEMGFDILYLPPIHPVGHSWRKGKNGSLTTTPEDPGSPWAIGSGEGGHKSIHPQLGTLEDFRSLVKRAGELKMEVALDIAFQCSPDHPYVREHPGWFRIRPDGSIQYAENPPKKYQDIYPFNFETDSWQALWRELKSIFEFWIEQGVRVFRVDNPHTKPMRFWQWCLGELKRDHPETIFLSEAFTRRKVMYHLAKLGFTQSYNYFPWRNTKHELTEYFTELTTTEIREYFRPSLWTNTPDILTQYLQYGGRPAFMTRFILAATLGASYGMYGPAFELCVNEAREFGSEEYLDSEKYEIKHWNLKDPGSLRDLIARVNQIRRENPALQSDWSLEFHDVDNDQIIAYSKATRDYQNLVITVVNLNPHHTHAGWVRLPIEKWGLGPQDTFQVHDLLTDARHLWHGERNYVELNPRFLPAHILKLRRYVRTERDFDYFM